MGGLKGTVRNRLARRIAGRRVLKRGREVDGREHGVGRRTDSGSLATARAVTRTGSLP